MLKHWNQWEHSIAHQKQLCHVRFHFQESETQTEIRWGGGKMWDWGEYFASHPKHANLKGDQENTVHSNTVLVWKDIHVWILKSIFSEVSDSDISV